MSAKNSPGPAGHGRTKSSDRSSHGEGNADHGDVQVELENMQPAAQLPIEEDLMGLARLGELRAIQKLFDTGKYTANSTDPQGITALHVRGLSWTCTTQEWKC